MWLKPDLLPFDISKLMQSFEWIIHQLKLVTFKKKYFKMQIKQHLKKTDNLGIL